LIRAFTSAVVSACVLGASFNIHVQAQSPSRVLAFDVVSIKENPRSGTGGSMRTTPDGGVRAQHVTTVALVAAAYGLNRYEMSGAPDWTRDVYYDVDARPPAQTSRAQAFTMVQAMLAERFKLVFHREDRSVDGFALLRGSNDKLGPGLRPSALDCLQARAATQKCREGGITADSMIAYGAPFSSVLNLIIGEVAAPVVDRTGLKGTYDIDLHWSNDLAAANDLPSIFTAVSEQLGLKLQPEKTTASIFVIDHIERPSEN
jgi:uncharacterized protein (TIGR03435 family)